MVVKIKDIDCCCGCGACYDSCPSGAINFKSDALGFSFPRIDPAVCLNCGACHNVCFRKIDCEHVFSKKAYVLSSSDADDRNNSASGGVFRTLAKYMLEHNGLVFGANLSFSNSKPYVRHICVDTPNDLNKICGSIYVESDCKEAYVLIREALKKGTSVLFCGTSCQVDGLYRFLGDKPSGLFTIDLIDHGVPSIGFFREYVSFLSKKYKTEVVSFKFRRKEHGIIRYEEEISFKNGIKKIIKAKDSAYYYYFLNGETYRQCCYNCKYSSLDKPADLTIGDYFDLASDYPDILSKIKNNNGDSFVSACLVNTCKGNDLILKCANRFSCYSVDAERIRQSHPQLLHPTRCSKKRQIIIKRYQKKGFKSVEGTRKRELLLKMPIRIIKKIAYLFRRKD